MTATQLLCRGTRKDGAPCRTGFNLSADGFCLNHDPARADEARRAQAKAKQRGGASVKELRLADREDLPTPHQPKTLEEVKLWAAWLAFELVLGGIDTGIAREANKALLTLAYQLRYESGLEKRLRELERKLGKQAGTRAD